MLWRSRKKPLRPDGIGKKNAESKARKKKLNPQIFFFYQFISILYNIYSFVHFLSVYGKTKCSFCM